MNLDTEHSRGPCNYFRIKSFKGLLDTSTTLHSHNPVTKVHKSLNFEAFSFLDLMLKFPICPLFHRFGLESNCCTVGMETAEKAKYD
jgi:hypothetical protein